MYMTKIIIILITLANCCIAPLVLRYDRDKGSGPVFVAERGEFPWLVYVTRRWGHYSNDNDTFVCNAVIISPHFVLCPARCVSFPISPRRNVVFTVVTGAYDRSVAATDPEHNIKLVSRTVQTTLVLEVIIHPKFDITRSKIEYNLENTLKYAQYWCQVWNYDFALLRTKTSIKFSEHTQPVKIPNQEELKDTTNQTKLVASGYGLGAFICPLKYELVKSANLRLAYDRPHKAYFGITENDDCGDSFRFQEHNPNETFCAQGKADLALEVDNTVTTTTPKSGQPNGTATSEGVVCVQPREQFGIGAGLVQIQTENNSNPVHVLYGLLSAKTAGKVCSPSANGYAFFGNVANVAEWITDTSTAKSCGSSITPPINFVDFLINVFSFFFCLIISTIIVVFLPMNSV